MGEGRIPLLSGDDAAAAARAAGLDEQVASLSLNRALLHHERMARRFNAYFSQLMFEHRLPARLRELVVMRVAWTTGSVYEWTQHWDLATGLGVPEGDLLALRGGWPAHPGFSLAERAALEATDDVVAHGRISPSAWERCAARLDDAEQLVELVLAIAGWRMVATVVESLAVPLEDGVDAWPPDGRAPDGRAGGGEP